MTRQSVSVIGMGYVGLCLAVGFASRGFKVIVSDIDKKKTTLIKMGKTPFHEPNLNGLLRKALTKGNFESTPNRQDAVRKTDITFVTVGTPSKPDGSINLQFIKKASEEIGQALSKKRRYHLVIVKSTVIPGTTERVVKPLLERNSHKKCGENFGLCVNPEFLREGSALHDIFHPDRVIIGQYDKKSGDTLQNLYKNFYGNRIPKVLRTNLPTAELVKYANNAFLATKISFINTIANICEKIPGVDVTTVAKAIGMDKRIASSFLRAGLGYGGSCFPKDIKALLAYSKNLGYRPELLEAVENVNKDQTRKPVQLCKRLLGELKDKNVAILGVSFKPNTDDIREA
ncbi:MAG: UDP-glucose dehydrogenase family protein, partial [Candidatus Ranarchaeia archaeon]